MLLVKTFLDKSAIHGLGVFAGEDIKKGQLIWTMQEGFDQVLDPEFIAALPQSAQDYIATYGYRHDGKIIVTGDNDRYTNHSESPNTKALDDGGVIALRDIKKGEEITTDYREFDELHWQKLMQGKSEGQEKVACTL